MHGLYIIFEAAHTKSLISRKQVASRILGLKSRFAKQTVIPAANMESLLMYEAMEKTRGAFTPVLSSTNTTNTTVAMQAGTNATTSQ